MVVFAQQFFVANGNRNRIADREMGTGSQCTFEGNHCFARRGAFQTGTLTLDTVEHILAKAERLGTIEEQ